MKNEDRSGISAGRLDANEMKRLMNRFICVAVLIATPSQTWAAEGPLLLENPRIAVEIDRQSGAICSVRDKKQGVVYPQTGIGFEVETGDGIVRSKQASTITNQAGHVKLCFSGSGLDIALHYHLGEDDYFIEKWLEIKSGRGKPYFLNSVVLEDITTEAFSEIHFHDDQTIWHCPINLFLRGDKGGCFAGIEYPYWDLKQNGKEGFRLGYQPNYQVASGETNVSEKYFIGVYRERRDPPGFAGAVSRRDPFPLCRLCQVRTVPAFQVWKDPRTGGCARSPRLGRSLGHAVVHATRTAG